MVKRYKVKGPVENCFEVSCGISGIVVFSNTSRHTEGRAIGFSTKEDLIDWLDSAMVEVDEDGGSA